MPSEWDKSFIISLFKGKGEASDRSNYRGLKLTEHVLKVLKPIIKVFIRKVVNVDDMQFGFILDHFHLKKKLRKNISKRIVIFILHLLSCKRSSIGCPERSYGGL